MEKSTNLIAVPLNIIEKKTIGDIDFCVNNYDNNIISKVAIQLKEMYICILIFSFYISTKTRRIQRKKTS